jgi:hypothetical protein
MFEKEKHYVQVEGNWIIPNEDLLSHKQQYGEEQNKHDILSVVL